MTQDATSLDRLHDLVLPPDVPLWPPASGWYAVLGLALLAGGWLVWRGWARWRRDAPRREALHELARLHDAPAIAELLRRVALAGAPRADVVARSGSAWLDWLDAQAPPSMPADVRAQLIRGVYGPRADADDVTALRDYAARWIRDQRVTDARAAAAPHEPSPC